MMKGIYFAPYVLSRVDYKGILNKNQYIAKAYKTHGIEVDFIYLFEDNVVLNNTPLLSFTNTSLGTLKARLHDIFEALKKQVSKDTYSFIIFRNPFSTPFFALTLRWLKNNYPSIKLILDLPTYPYSKENPILLNIIDNILRPFTIKHIDHIITFCEQDKIFNKQTIKISNGIEVESIKAITKTPKNNDQIELLAVANVASWHGFDRVLKGLALYHTSYALPKVRFTIVGQTAYMLELEKLAVELNISEMILFKGYLTGSELDQAYNNADVGISTLGMHRKNVTQDSSLKSREYCARGLPFILSTNDKDFPQNLPFVQYHPVNDEPIDIAQVVSFYLKLVAEYPHYSEMMRTYADEHLSWVKKITPIVEALR